MESYRFNIARYRAETRDFGPADDLVYRRLIDFYYIREGPLPNSLQDLANLIDFDVEVVAGVVEAMFTPSPEGWRKAEFDADIAARKPNRLKKPRGRPRRIVVTAP